MTKEELDVAKKMEINWGAFTDLSPKQVALIDIAFQLTRIADALKNMDRVSRGC